MTVAQKKKYLGVGWLPSLYAATFSSWFCYSLLHAECSLLLLLDMFSVTVAGRCSSFGACFFAGKFGTVCLRSGLLERSVWLASLGGL